MRRTPPCYTNAGDSCARLSAWCQLDVLAVPVDGDEPVPRGWLVVVAPPVVGGSHLVVQLARPGLLDLVGGGVAEGDGGPGAALGSIR